jgi:coproporphyrinogen III oxidase-like Fe-S oxidoreductase
MLNACFDFQRLRHRRLATVARKWVYRLLVGDDAWPLVFRRRDIFSEIAIGTSPHIYVHVPFCRSICPHCPYNITLYDTDLYKRYRSALLCEIRQYLDTEKSGPIQSLYFGGGTPSMTPGLIADVIAILRPHLARDAEVAAEVHPADAELALLHQLKAVGINRISLGIETFSADLLRTLGRRYTREEAERSIMNTQMVGFECVDVNLIFGIPGQSPHSAAQDARKCLELGADQISAYPLFTFAHTGLGKRVAASKFQIYDDRDRLRTQRRISRLCRDMGFVRTSVWSFTRPGVRPYTTVTRDSYRGFGAGAGSKIDGVFSFNTFSVADYSECSEHRPALVLEMSKRLRRAHWLYWQIYRTQIDPTEYERLFQGCLEREFATVFLLLRALRWIEKRGCRWQLTESGAVWCHRLQSLFSLAYIDEIWQRCRRDAWPIEVILDRA